ncbi:hypothetical protein [Marivita sp. GX14005]|uniref:hypothetical protein n=1 Tax=Marivita sp. GX14005 TaxID=2942276 RepID=UPI00201918E7|nr:hypothetical protein [Marivita sp. GX14005]MCL3881574.1 hypothetical protein [Marivita sp. GX14005]
MKSLIATTALALVAFTGAASAMPDTSAIKQYAPQANVSALSEAQVNTILSVIHSGDSESEKRLRVQAIVNR